MRYPIVKLLDWRAWNEELAASPNPFAVVALDTRTGMARRVVAVGVGPRSIGPDEHRQRALVVNTALNPDGSFADPPAPQGAWTWTERIPWVGAWLSRFGQPRPVASPNGQGSMMVLDLSRL